MSSRYLSKAFSISGLSVIGEFIVIILQVPLAKDISNIPLPNNQTITAISSVMKKILLGVCDFIINWEILENKGIILLSSHAFE